MEILNDLNKKPQIKYPCKWNYKVIGRSKQDIKDQISKIINLPYEIEDSKISKNKKFISLNLFVDIQNDAQRKEIFQKLNKLECIDWII